VDGALLELLHHKVRNGLKVTGIFSDDLESMMQRSRPDQQIRKRKNDAALGLPSRDRARSLRDLIRERTHRRGRPKLLKEHLSPLPLRFRFRPFNTVCQFDDGYRRQTGPRFATRPLNLFQYFGNAVSAPFQRDQVAGIDDHSHDAGFRGCRLRTISCTSSAKSGSRTAADPRSFSRCLAMTMDSESKRPGCRGAG